MSISGGVSPTGYDMTLAAGPLEISEGEHVGITGDGSGAATRHEGLVMGDSSWTQDEEIAIGGSGASASEHESMSIGDSAFTRDVELAVGSDGISYSYRLSTPCGDVDLSCSTASCLEWCSNCCTESAAKISRFFHNLITNMRSCPNAMEGHLETCLEGLDGCCSEETFECLCFIPQLLFAMIFGD